MSRIGKLPVKIPAGVTVNVANNTIAVKGKLGELKKALPKLVSVTVQGQEVLVQPQDKTKQARAQWGLIRSIINNMVHGVVEGFTVRIEMLGVGFRAAIEGQIINLSLGYSHEIKYAFPKDIKIVAEKPTLLVITGTDKQLVGQVASELMRLRPVEPYKGKGVYKEGAYKRRKEGKKK